MDEETDPAAPTDPITLKLIIKELRSQLRDRERVIQELTELLAEAEKYQDDAN